MNILQLISCKYYRNFMRVKNFVTQLCNLCNHIVFFSQIDLYVDAIKKYVRLIFLKLKIVIFAVEYNNLYIYIVIINY